MDARPEIPDPQHDRHVAFSDDAPEPPPESWWAPTPAPTPPPTSSAPPAAPAPRAPAARRRSISWWVLIGLFLLGGVMSSGSGTESGTGGTVDGIAHGEAYGQSSPGLDLGDLAVAPAAGLLPEDAALYPIPPGTIWFRLEVVGNEPRGTVLVTDDAGSSVNAGEVALPYSARLTRNDPQVPLTVTVHGAYGQQQVQCRVYLSDALVAIGTGAGTTTCEVPAWR